MPEVGMPELFVLTLVALVILGPERLPHAVRTAARWIGYARRQAAALSAQLEREAGLVDLKRTLELEEVQAEVRRLQQCVAAESRVPAPGMATERELTRAAP